MSGREQMILNSTWQTVTYAKGDYTISIVATPVPGEVDTTDDSYMLDGSSGYSRRCFK